MSRKQRLLLLPLGVAAVVVVFLVARGGSSDKVKSAGPTTIEVSDAKPVGGVRALTYQHGHTVDLTVRSDTGDEVHFHGYDFHKDVEPGGSVRFRFPAKIDGEFIVELEEHKQTLAKVTVKP
jgi:hypothetical protein